MRRLTTDTARWFKAILQYSHCRIAPASFTTFNNSQQQRRPACPVPSSPWSVVQFRQRSGFPSNMTNKLPEKIFNDPIHGHIKLSGLCVRIIDTPQFQRLRHIKQLGGAYYVYPGAAHNRFEHCLGVCFLAGHFVRCLKDDNPDAAIDEKDVMCVEIAGLCHDLGHGPFSHTFQKYFMDIVKPEPIWNHEKTSIDLFDYIIAENKTVKEAFELCNLDKKDEAFIKQLINGKKPKESEDVTGRKPDKDFLYEIVANAENGIDVDKFDYFARDCYYLGIKNSFDHDRLIKSAKIIDVAIDEKTKRKHICYRDKDAENIYDMFYQRMLLHHRACQHKTICSIELMHMEALREVKDHLKIAGNGHAYTIAECVANMDGFTNLTDSIFERILRRTDLLISTSGSAEGDGDAKRTMALNRAFDLLDRVDKRRHFKCVGEALVEEECKYSREKESQLEAKIAECSPDKTLEEKDILVNVVMFSYSKGNTNPVDKVYFYSKRYPNKARQMKREQISTMLPSVFREYHLRVYAREDEKAEMVYNAFRKYCEKHKLKPIKDFHE